MKNKPNVVFKGGGNFVGLFLGFWQTNKLEMFTQITNCKTLTITYDIPVVTNWLMAFINHTGSRVFYFDGYEDNDQRDLISGPTGYNIAFKQFCLDNNLINCQRPDGRTALMQAVHLSNEPAVIALISWAKEEGGTDITLQDHQGRTAQSFVRDPTSNIAMLLNYWSLVLKEGADAAGQSGQYATAIDLLGAPPQFPYIAECDYEAISGN